VDEARKPTIRVNLSHIPLKLNQYLGEALKQAMQPYWGSETDQKVYKHERSILWSGRNYLGQKRREPKRL
jgi:hypothetical protein